MKKKNTVKLAWRPVELPFVPLDGDDELQYLAGFEELDSYVIDQTSSKSVKRRKNNSDTLKKSKKRRRKDSADKIVEPVTTDCSTSVEQIETIDDTKQIMSSNLSLEDKSDDIGTSVAWNSLGIAEEIVRALCDLNFTEPTAIQKLCVGPAIRDHLDILGAAETGSGKTLAFGIPIIHGLLNSSDDDDEILSNGPKALILTPTRELALQIKQHIAAILKYTPFKITSIIGGLSSQKQERLLKKRPEILVATPGRLWAMIEEKVEYLKNLQNLRYLVIDETDRMVEKGHFAELSSILEYLKNDDEGAKIIRQTFVFSATLTFVHPPPKRLLTKVEVRQMTPEQKVEMLVSLTGLRKERKIIDITRKFGTCETLLETRLNCSNLIEKDTYLYYFLLNYPGRTLIFTNSVNCTRRLKNLLSRLQFPPLFLHAQMHQKQRLKNLETFSDCPTSVMLATDVAARGLDIKNIEHVLHYQVPRTAEIYVHRSGRTARASREGLSVMLVDAQDALNYKKICKSLNREKDLPLFPLNFVQIPLLRDRVRLASELESLEHRNAKVSSAERWFSRTAREAELELDEDELQKNLGDNSTTKLATKEKERLEIQLKFLLKQSLPKEKGLTTKYPTSLTELQSKLIAPDTESSGNRKNALETLKSVDKITTKTKIIGKHLKLKDRKRRKNKLKRKRKK